jgi:hypothetical protein
LLDSVINVLCQQVEQVSVQRVSARSAR